MGTEIQKMYINGKKKTAIHIKQHRYPPIHREEIVRQIHEVLRCGQCRRSRIRKEANVGY